VSKKMICPNWMKCKAEGADCAHRRVHDFLENYGLIVDGFGNHVFKGCDRCSTLNPTEGNGCEANGPDRCVLYPCLRAICGGCIGVEEDDLS
jgi:hypothetical protein